MTKVKICGITNPDDARRAVDYGADLLGFNFYANSPRFISAEAASAIIRLLPGAIINVGVFVNEQIEAIVATVNVAGLGAVQLHGDETPDFVDELRERIDQDVIKAFRVSNSFDPEVAFGYSSTDVLLDGFSLNAHGGTGRTFDWSVAKLLSPRIEKLYLAGGLSAENVRTAISEVHPYAVDACSSVESRPGIKDAEKLLRFIMEAKRDD